MAPLGKFVKKFGMLQMHNKKYENNLEFSKQKATQCIKYLKCFHNRSDGDIFTRHVLQK
jgi:uncharacterized protein (UPF0332 family)